MNNSRELRFFFAVQPEIPNTFSELKCQVMDQYQVYSVIMEWVGEEKTLGNGQCT